MRKTFLLRISPELWEELSRWASDDLRSVNGHIEFLLRDAVRRPVFLTSGVARRGLGAVLRAAYAEIRAARAEAPA